MPKYILSYRNPIGYAPTQDSTAAWMTWFDSMGDRLVDLGKPVFTRTVLGNCSPDTTELGGFSVIEVEDLDAAVAVAKGCPHLDRSGGVEVGQLGEVSELRPATQ